MEGPCPRGAFCQQGPRRAVAPGSCWDRGGGRDDSRNRTDRVRPGACPTDIHVLREDTGYPTAGDAAPAGPGGAGEKVPAAQAPGLASSRVFHWRRPERAWRQREPRAELRVARSHLPVPWAVVGGGVPLGSLCLCPVGLRPGCRCPSAPVGPRWAAHDLLLLSPAPPPPPAPPTLFSLVAHH